MADYQDTQNTHDGNPKSKRLQKLLGVLVCMILLLVGICGGYVYYVWSSMGHTGLNNFVEGDVTLKGTIDLDGKKPEEVFGIAPEVVEKIDEKNRDVTNVLLLGLDRRFKNEASRTDAMIIASIDRNNEQLKMTSLMRDMYLTIPGKKDGRINTAYFMGGPALAISTVNTNFKMDIRHYVSVDFAGLEKIIDTLGGLDIDITNAERQDLNGIMQEINDNDKSYKSPDVAKAGLQTLNGRQAVCYARIRHVGNGDFQRVDRQKYVLSLILEKGLDRGALKLADMIAAIAPYVETNMSAKEIFEFATDVFNMQDHSLHAFRLPTDDGYRNASIDGASVLVPNTDKCNAALEAFIYEKAAD